MKLIKDGIVKNAGGKILIAKLKELGFKEVKKEPKKEGKGAK